MFTEEETLQLRTKYNFHQVALVKYQESGNNAEMKLDEDLDSDSSSPSVNIIDLNKEKTKKKKRMTQLAIQMIQRRKMRRNNRKDKQKIQ